MSKTATNEPAIRADEFETLVRREMGDLMPISFAVELMERGRVRLRLHYESTHLRPGNTIAGPVMFTLADTALYALTMSVAGWQPMAVTTDVNLHFLRRPEPGDLIAEARILRAGRRMVVGDVEIYSDGEDEPVAHATGTYVVPGPPAGQSVSNR